MYWDALVASCQNQQTRCLHSQDQSEIPNKKVFGKRTERGTHSKTAIRPILQLRAQPFLQDINSLHSRPCKIVSHFGKRLFAWFRWGGQQHYADRARRAVSHWFHTSCKAKLGVWGVGNIYVFPKMLKYSSKVGLEVKILQPCNWGIYFFFFYKAQSNKLCIYSVSPKDNNNSSSTATMLHGTASSQKKQKIKYFRSTEASFSQVFNLHKSCND